MKSRITWRWNADLGTWASWWPWPGLGPERGSTVWVGGAGAGAGAGEQEQEECTPVEQAAPRKLGAKHDYSEDKNTDITA